MFYGACVLLWKSSGCGRLAKAKLGGRWGWGGLRYEAESGSVLAKKSETICIRWGLDFRETIFTWEAIVGKRKAKRSGGIDK